jgi:DNA-binding transcriptional ArsR family regulator
MERVFAALDSQVRRQILVYLASQQLTNRELTSRFDITAPAMCRHLRILEDANLIARTDGKHSPYKIQRDNLVQAFNGFLGVVYQRVSPPSELSSTVSLGLDQARAS